MVVRRRGPRRHARMEPSGCRVLVGGERRRATGRHQRAARQDGTRGAGHGGPGGPGVRSSRCRSTCRSSSWARFPKERSDWRCSTPSFEESPASRPLKWRPLVPAAWRAEAPRRPFGRSSCSFETPWMRSAPIVFDSASSGSLRRIRCGGFTTQAGEVSPRLPVTYSAATSGGAPIGTFSGVTLSNQGVSSATFNVGARARMSGR